MTRPGGKRSATEGGLGCGGGDGMRRRDELDTRAGLGDGGEIEDCGGGGDDRRVDRKVKQEPFDIYKPGPFTPGW